MIDTGFLIDCPTDEARPSSKKNLTRDGSKRSAQSSGLAQRERIHSTCPVRKMGDIPIKFRKPAKPPTR